MERVTNYDILALFENQLWLERKCQTDQDFSKKFGNALREISSILKGVNLRRDLSIQSLRRISSEFHQNLEDFLVPTRNYKSFKSRFAGSFQILPAKQPGIPVGALPPRKVIGKGYGDKGTLKDEARDGSPSWQEVAVAKCNPDLQEIEEILSECKTSEDICWLFANLFREPKEPLKPGWRSNFTKAPIDSAAAKAYKELQRAAKEDVVKDL